MHDLHVFSSWKLECVTKIGTNLAMIVAVIDVRPDDQ
jgi:hypothetical protein